MKNLHATKALKTSFNLTLFSLNLLSSADEFANSKMLLLTILVYYILESTYRIIPVLQVFVGPVVSYDMLYLLFIQKTKTVKSVKLTAALD